MKDIKTKLNESRKNNDVKQPFISKDEFMQFIDDIAQTKTIIKKYEDKAQTYYNEIQKLRRKANNVSSKEEFEQINTQIEQCIKQADDIMQTQECVAAQNKLYDVLQQRALDSLSAKEQKSIGRRGGRLYNIMKIVIKKYDNL